MICYSKKVSYYEPKKRCTLILLSNLTIWTRNWQKTHKNMCLHIWFDAKQDKFPFSDPLLIIQSYLSISPGISEIWNHCSNIFGWSPPTSINHYQKLHKILICRRTHRLHKINITPSNTLSQLNIYLTISKTFNLNSSKLQTHVACYFLLNMWWYIRNMYIKIFYV